MKKATLHNRKHTKANKNRKKNAKKEAPPGEPRDSCARHPTTQEQNSPHWHSHSQGWISCPSQAFRENMAPQYKTKTLPKQSVPNTRLEPGNRTPYSHPYMGPHRTRGGDQQDPYITSSEGGDLRPHPLIYYFCGSSCPRYPVRGHPLEDVTVYSKHWTFSPQATEDLIPICSCLTRGPLQKKKFLRLPDDPEHPRHTTDGATPVNLNPVKHSNPMNRHIVIWIKRHIYLNSTIINCRPPTLVFLSPILL
jgi:hypothetical protein